MTWLIDQRYFALDFPWRLLAASIVIVIVAVLAWWKKQLSISGLVAAVIMGLATTLLGGFSSLSLYLFFLLSAAVIGRLSKRIRGLDRIHKKGGRRDWMQVLANGGPALVAVIAHAVTRDPVFLAVFTAALGEACADTWASEIGVLSKKDPLSILTFTRVPRGLSGGVSALGTGAALLASLLYGVFAYSCYAVLPIGLCVTVALTAFLGVLVDSMLGATVQAHYYDKDDDIITEHSKDKEGRALKLARGLRFIDNDMVNLLSNCVSFLLCLSLGQLFF